MNSETTLLDTAITPTLPVLLTVIGALEFPILVPLPVKTGTVPAVPLPVTCAAALIANAAMQIATAAILLCIVFLILS